MTPLFRLYLWPQRLLLLGPALDTGLHRHHAAQFCLGLQAPVRLREAPAGQWQSAQGFYVAPDQPHQLDASATPCALLYLDAQGEDFRSLPQGTGMRPLHAVPALEGLRRLHLEGGSEAAATAAVGLLLNLDAEHPRPQELRLQAALDWIEGQLGGGVRIAGLAAALQLSESHVAHWFRRHTGIPLRRYVAWRRLRRALQQAMQGASLTEAAHAAGFADSAHLSRSFRDHFGVAPSFLFEHRAQIAMQFCGDRPRQPNAG